MTNTQITIKENKFFRIVNVWNDYFIDGKNKFGRWVTIKSIQVDEIDSLWSKAEIKAAELAKVAA